MKRLMTIVFAMMFVAACGGKKKEDGGGGAEYSSGSTGTIGSGIGSTPGIGSDALSAAQVAAEVDVPTAEDFEAEASQRITEKTLDKELSAIEQELQQ